MCDIKQGDKSGVNNLATLSIVILTCNQKDFTLRCLQSLTPYIKDESGVEVLLVDNGSQDSTISDVRGWMRNNNLPEERLQIIEMRRNVGVAAGRNVGLQKAKGEMLLLLDNDTIANAAAIEACRKHLMEHSECGVCAPALYSPAGESQSSAKPFPGLGVKLRHVLLRGKESQMEERELKKEHPFYLIGAFQMFRREDLEKVGMLDEAIFYGPEDADFCMRMQRLGKTIDYLPQYGMIHDWQRATHRSPLSRLGLKHAKGLLHFYWKHKRFF